jgi:uncharacterized protein (TIRG00374 family)
MTAAAPPRNQPLAAPGAPRGARLALWLLLVVGVYLAIAWAVGGQDTLASAARIGARWMLLGAALTTLNFALRALRWHFLLRATGAVVPALAGSAIYLAGIGLSLTPGKLGETVRSAFLLRHGVAVGTSLAAFVVDRISDVHAVVLIALFATAGYLGWGDPAVVRWAWLLLAVALAPIALSLLARSALWPRLIALLARRQRLQRVADWLSRAGGDFPRLWHPAIALPSIMLSLLAYGLQAATFAGMVAQVAPSLSPWVAASIFASATLAGAASFIPGGIGAMEIALVVMLGNHDVPTASALAAALCLRAVTFWFGLLLGAGGLAVAGRVRHG